MIPGAVLDHYQILTSLLAPALLEGFSKTGTHTAMADARESVAELAYYRRFLGRLGGVA